MEIKRFKRAIALAMVVMVANGSVGCSFSQGALQSVRQSLASHFNQENHEQSTETNSDEKEVKAVVEEVKSSQSAKQLKDCIDNNFKSNTVSLALDDKSKKEIKLYLTVLQNLDFISYKDGKMKYKAPSIDGIINYLSKDYNGFVKDYNNFLTLKLSEEEIEDYVLDYLAQLFSEDGEGVESVKMETKTCKVTLTRGGKLSTDSFLTELANEVITDLPTKIKGTTFSQEPPKANTKVKTSDFKIGKSKVMLCPVIGEDDKITSQQKILVTVDTVLKDEEALEKLCTISEMNRSLNVDFQENSLYYIHYTVKNGTSLDLTYNNNFSLVGNDGNSYSLPNGSCFGLTSSTVLKKGSDTALDVALIGPKTAKLGWYDNTTKYFYQLGVEDE